MDISEVYCLMELAVSNGVRQVIGFGIDQRVASSFVLPMCYVVRPTTVRVWSVDMIEKSIFLWGCCRMVWGLRMYL
jgi:hypothetical protein